MFKHSRNTTGRYYTHNNRLLARISSTRNQEAPPVEVMHGTHSLQHKFLIHKQDHEHLILLEKASPDDGKLTHCNSSIAQLLIQKQTKNPTRWFYHGGISPVRRSQPRRSEQFNRMLILALRNFHDTEQRPISMSVF